ncbi:hypothetical protein CSUI_007713 [Cystoisospora suis]|uniref:Secreted protein n=1 Tax=Cystoisospora suis TaxID=483139 RepID=A0A2C6KQ18_9APIC|nr:hypothetical protein CSUI_007713 [Cystoisospora suis]
MLCIHWMVTDCLLNGLLSVAGCAINSASSSLHLGWAQYCLDTPVKFFASANRRARSVCRYVDTTSGAEQERRAALGFFQPAIQTKVEYSSASPRTGTQTDRVKLVYAYST